jgi:hypothetical protein
LPSMGQVSLTSSPRRPIWKTLGFVTRGGPARQTRENINYGTEQDTSVVVDPDWFFNTDPDKDFYLTADSDPDPGSQINADPDQTLK